MCVTVVQWSRSFLHVQVNRVRLPATLPSVSLYRYFFSLLVYFFNTIFPFGLFFFTLTADPAGHALGSIYILSLSREFYFGKGISKALGLHTGQAYDQIYKNHKLSRHVPPLKRPNFSTVCGVLCNCFSWCQLALICEINFVTSKQFFSAIDAVWSWWSCIYHEFKYTFEENSQLKRVFQSYFALFRVQGVDSM